MRNRPRRRTLKCKHRQHNAAIELVKPVAASDCQSLRPTQGMLNQDVLPLQREAQQVSHHLAKTLQQERRRCPCVGRAASGLDKRASRLRSPSLSRPRLQRQRPAAAPRPGTLSAASLSPKATRPALNGLATRGVEGNYRIAPDRLSLQALQALSSPEVGSTACWPSIGG